MLDVSDDGTLLIIDCSIGLVDAFERLKCAILVSNVDMYGEAELRVAAENDFTSLHFSPPPREGYQLVFEMAVWVVGVVVERCIFFRSLLPPPTVLC